MRLIANIIFYTTYSSLCCVQHNDDVFTTGESFRQLQRKMKQLGALSVIGVFLGKTV